MAEGVEIGKGYVAIDADMTQFNAFAKALPGKFAAVAKSSKAGWNAIWADGQAAGGLDKIGAMATRAGQQIKQAGSNGAMGLMVLSQTIDDAQYGLQAIVNNMPQVGMAIGGALGMSSEAAMKFGGAMGIAAVAVNTWVKNADHVKAIFGRGESEGVKQLARDLTELGDTARSVFASIANLDQGFNWVRTTGKDVDALTKQMEDRAKFEAESAARAKSNRSSVAGIKEQGADKRGAGFGEAVAAYGGGDKLANEIAARRIGEMGKDTEEFDPWRHGFKADFNKAKADRQQLRERQAREKVDADIAAAKEGDKDAIDRLAKEDPKLKNLIKYNAPGMKEARDKQTRANDTAADRTAKNLKDTVGRELLNNPDMGIPELWSKVKEAMEKAGYSTKEIADTLPSVASKIKAEIAGDVKDRSDKDNIAPADARTMMLHEASERDKQEIERKTAPMTQEAERLANAMSGGVGKKLLENGGISDEDLTGNVRKGLKASGMAESKIDEVAVLVAKKLREKVEAEVQTRSLNEGVSEGKARQDMLAEANEAASRDRPKAEVLSDDSYFNKLLVAGLSRESKDPAADKALAAQEGTAKATTKFADLAEKWEARGIKVQGNGGGATFQRGRGM